MLLDVDLKACFLVAQGPRCKAEAHLLWADLLEVNLTNIFQDDRIRKLAVSNRRLAFKHFLGCQALGGGAGRFDLADDFFARGQLS